MPTKSSRLALVDRWFKELSDRRLRRGTFPSVPALVEAIKTWGRARDARAKVKSATNDSILARVASPNRQRTFRVRALPNGTGGTSMKVVFIAGVARSGSTALDLLLGTHPKLMGVGELYLTLGPSVL